MRTVGREAQGRGLPLRSGTKSYPEKKWALGLSLGSLRCRELAPPLCTQQKVPETQPLSPWV